MNNSKTMKKFLSLMFVMITVLIAIPTVANADVAAVPIHLIIQTSDQTLFDGDLSVNACPDTETGTTTTVNALCAVNQVASSSGWTLATTWSSFGVFLNGINNYAPLSVNGPYWIYYTDRNPGFLALNTELLTSGEEILLAFDKNPLRVLPATTTPEIGTSTLLQAQYFDPIIFDWVPATSTTFMVSGVPTQSDASGTLSYIPSSTDTLTVSAVSPGYISSKPITLFPKQAPVSLPQGITIHFDVESFDQTLYNNDVTVYPCPDTQFGTTTTANAFCAVNQVASSSGWTLATTWYPFGENLDGINAYISDATNSRYWLYYTDREFPPVGLGTHVLTPGEEILLTFGTSPLRVVTATTSPSIGTPVVLESQVFDTSTYFDWTKNTGTTTFTIDGIATTSDAEGKLIITPTSLTPIVISISRAGFVASRPFTITPVDVPVVSTPPSGGSSVPEVTHMIDVAKAVQFLRANQNTDGSFATPLYTDWVAIGLSGVSGADDVRAKIKTYMSSHTDPGTLLTDIERRAMALEALGIDPSAGTSRNYVSDILARFDGTQFGDKNEVNDDMFALIPLLHAGYTVDNAEIVSSAMFIVSKQGADGSWGSIDLTAAGIEALMPLNMIPEVQNAITRAKGYLHSTQHDDGGFGSSFASGWVLTAINGISGDQLVRDWSKNGRTPADYLWSLQQPDGAVEPPTLDVNSRVWATAYALTGSIGKDWNGALTYFDKPQSSSQQSTGSLGSGEVLGDATTSIATATSTAATSTISVLIGSSTDPMLTMNSSGTSTASTTLSIKSTSTPNKVKVSKPKKKTTVNEPKKDKKDTASVANAALSPQSASPSSEAKSEGKGMLHFIRDPFARFFSFIGSFF